jgi:flagellar biosynthesis protein FliR
VIDEILGNSQLFLLVFVRILALIQIAPLLSSAAIPQIAKIALAFFTAFLVFPGVQQSGYLIPNSGLGYGMLVVGEAMVGIILGFFLVLIFAAFQVAGQFFSLQMGLGASQVFDPLAQIQIPLMGQFLNLMAMFVFLTVGGLRKIFLFGVHRSFDAFKAVDLLTVQSGLVRTILKMLTGLFEQALIISLPILGTLLLIYITIGLLAKAAPQMNLLMMGFPIAIGVALIILMVSLPFMVEMFVKIFEFSFDRIQFLLKLPGVAAP